MKVSKFIIQNYKSVRGTHEYVPAGSSFFLIGGNGVGKTSVGHALMDMLTKSLPSKPITDGEKTGYMEFTFTNGSKFLGRFVDGKKPQLEFITPEGYNVGSPKELLQQLAGEGMDFSIDDMLKMAPAPLRKKLEAVAGLDLTDLNLRYKMKYDERALANAKLRDQQGRIEPYEMKYAQMELVQASSLINRIQEMNSNLSAWNNAESRTAEIQAKIEEKTLAAERLRSSITETLPKASKAAQDKYEDDLNRAKIEYDRQVEIAKKNFSDANQRIQDDAKNLEAQAAKHLDEVEQLKTQLNPAATLPPKPAPEEVQALQAELQNLEETNRKIEHAKKMHSEFLYYEELEKQAAALNDEVNALNAEKEAKIKASPLPATGLAFDSDGNLTIDGFPFEDNQISASRKLIAGIEIASSMLGQIKYLHIDGAALDHASADYVLAFAESKGLQLCIERPEWDGGELKMEIVDQTGLHDQSGAIQEQSAPPATENAQNAQNAPEEPETGLPEAQDPTAQQPE